MRTKSVRSLEQARKAVSQLRLRVASHSVDEHFSTHLANTLRTAVGGQCLWSWSTVSPKGQWWFSLAEPGRFIPVTHCWMSYESQSVTTRWTGSMRRSLCATVLLSLVACGETPPPCSSNAPEPSAPSAGCLVPTGGGVVRVKVWCGEWGLPGGAVKNPSQRVAVRKRGVRRDGLAVQAGELAAVFDNGFHLYWCKVSSPDALTSTARRCGRLRGWHPTRWRRHRGATPARCDDSRPDRGAVAEIASASSRKY